MGVVLKTKEQPLTEELVGGMVGRIVHAKINKHLVPKQSVLVDTPIEGMFEEVNVWFAGVVVGYQRSVIGVDLMAETAEIQLLEKPLVSFNVVLGNMSTYTLSDKELEIDEITGEELVVLFEEGKAQEVAANLLQPVVTPQAALHLV